jgi:hypothetical protein
MVKAPTAPAGPILATDQNARGGDVASAIDVSLKPGTAAAPKENGISPTTRRLPPSITP